MKSWSQRLSLILVVVIFLFAAIPLSGGRRVRTAGKSVSAAVHEEEEEVPEVTTKPQYATAEFQRQFRWRLSAAGEKSSSERLRMLYDDEKHDRVYGVSAREVPGGPNPLHN